MYELTPGAGVYDDFSTYSRTLTATYTYTVPEPASFALLAAGAIMLAMVRPIRRSR